MKLRTLSLALTAVAAITPAISRADSADVALKACAQAFAAKIGSTAEEQAYKVVFPNKIVGSAISDYYAREFTFVMQARSKSGTSLAQATCSATSRGSVLALTTEAVGKSESFASR